MFKLKPGNVFQKMNQMDRKKAYTLGAIVVVCFIALITLASFLGDADDDSFDGLTTRGYDLAQMPFVNDEAEQYLLASKYPDMQGNNSTFLYSAQEKEARQAEDAANSTEEFGEDGYSLEEAYGNSAGATSSSRGGSGRGRGYYGGGGGGGTPTQVGQLGSASMGRASGSGVSGSWGAPRGDFSPYHKADKGTEAPSQPLRNQDARKALYQFARGSQAAAGLKDGKGANAKRALMGGNIQGSEAFTDKGIDLSKVGGLELDTNAPVSSADLSNLDKDVADAAKKAEEKKQEEKQSLGEKLWEQFLTGMVDMGLQALGKVMNYGVDAMFAGIGANSATKAEMRASLDSLIDARPPYSELQMKQMEHFGYTAQDAKNGVNFTDWAANKYLGKEMPSQQQDSYAATAARTDEILTKVQQIGSVDPMQTQKAQAQKLSIQQPKSVSFAQNDQGFDAGLDVGASFASQTNQPAQQGFQAESLAQKAQQATYKSTPEPLTAKESKKLREELRDAADGTYILGFNDDGSPFTKQQYRLQEYGKQMGRSSSTPITYNRPSNTNSDAGHTAYMKQHCANCKQGTAEWNKASAEYYNSLNK